MGHQSRHHDCLAVIRSDPGRGSVVIEQLIQFLTKSRQYIQEVSNLRKSTREEVYRIGGVTTIRRGECGAVK